MKDVDLYAKVRHAVRIEGLSKRAVARRFGIDPRTVDKMLEFSVPPGYRRLKPPVKPKLDPFLGMGCYVSFAGPVTFKKAEAIREAATHVPLDRLLLEALRGVMRET